MKKLLLTVVFLLGLLVLLVWQRQLAFYQLATLAYSEPPALLDAADELSTTSRFDDYFTVDELAPGTFAIGEPRYYQQNYNYLIIGTERAVLFDAGPGIRDIRPVVASLTDLPVVFLPSHFHYDHVGNGIEFSQRAVVDLPYLRARARGSELAFDAMEHFGPTEGFSVPTWQVDHWWSPGQPVDLGGRTIRLIHTPGHSRESISLLDDQNRIVLSGDFLYEGALYAFLPGSSLQDYLTTAQTLLRDELGTVYFGAHRATPPGPPRLSRDDLAALEAALLQIRRGELAGTGLWPVTYVVNQRISILAEPRLLQDWQ